MDIILLIGRILFAGVFLMFGINHFKKQAMMVQYAASRGVPSPKLAVIVGGLLLIAGGLGVILGIYVTLALWLLIIFLVPTTLAMHTFWKETDPQNKMKEMVNFMLNTALIGAALMLLSLPLPWAMSIL